MSTRPLFLLTNDDGVHAPGIRALAEAIRPLGDVVIVAPHVERSAMSHAMTISQPLRMEKLSADTYAVEGLPVDCVLLACRKILSRKPSWVLSGINRGGNLGIDVITSGTVGAALEGSLLGYKSMAISTEGRGLLDYSAAQSVVVKLLKNEHISHIAEKNVINVNVPNGPYTDVKGIKVTTLGRRIYDEDMYEGQDPRGRAYFWVGGGGKLHEDIPDSDCVLLDQGFATVSVLRTDYYDEAATAQLKAKLPHDIHK